MRILLLGKNGQLGWELHRCLAVLGTVTALDYPEIDLTTPDQISKLIRDVQPEVILNATAYTAVDRAETEPEIAQAVNSNAPGWLAEIAQTQPAALIHYSTDYVFDGTANRPYVETDPPHPLNEYGRSKLAGETAIQQIDGAYLILRTSWVYSLRRDSFVTKVLGWSRKQRVLRVVADQISNPTWARMLAQSTAQVLMMGNRQIVDWIGERKGIYHLAGMGHTSRMDWARAILKYDPDPEDNLVEEIQPAVTDEFPTPARRPLFSALDCSRFSETFGFQLPAWEHALKLAMEGYGN